MEDLVVEYIDVLVYRVDLSKEKRSENFLVDVQYENEVIRKNYDDAILKVG